MQQLAARHRKALGDYLRDRRCKLDPTTFGFSPLRRRTPGLRREEVAQRANVSATWYTWLEQGRGGAPSAETLDRIAQALALSDIEREHVYLLAFGHPPEQRRTGTSGITQQLQRVLEAMGSSPALLATSAWDIVAWNDAATRTFGDYAAIPPDRRNTLRFLFSPGGRERMADWESHARAVVGLFRAETTRLGFSERATRLVEELSRESAEFAVMWNARDVAALGPGTKRLVREGRTITLDYATFAVHGQRDLHMIVYTPRGDEDAALLRTMLDAQPRSGAAPTAQPAKSGY